MPSKGIQCYSYNAVPDCQIEFSVNGVSVVQTSQKTWTLDRLEMDKSKIPGLFNYTGTFRCRVTQSGNELMNKFVNINVLTGTMEQGNIKSMVDQQAVISNNVVISYTFYDSPQKPTAGLPNLDQFYCSVSPNYSGWQGSVAPIGSALATKPFRRFVLPAAHDVGMNSMQNANGCLQNALPAFLNLLTTSVGVFSAAPATVGTQVTAGLAPNIIQGLAITQKDTLNTILNTGARYFEFRPAYLHGAIRSAHPIPDVLYFMHGPIPGMRYDEFLAGVVDFLNKNSGEIVVIQNRWDGVPKECGRPTDEELTQQLNQALSLANGGIKAGSLDDMNRLSIDELRTNQKRLIVLQNVDSYSTYDDKANATLNGNTIIDQFNKASADLQRGKAFTNLQCQATASNLKNVVLFSSLTANTSNSCLLATKAICDNKTMPWIRANALSKLTEDQCIVIMDDFVDGGMCDLARDLSVQRLQR